MRKYVVASIIVVLLAGSIFWLFKPKDAPREVLFLTESHYILYQPYEKLTFTYFTNDPDFILTDQYSAGFIENEDGSIKFIIDHFTIQPIHNEYFKDMLFYGFKMSCLLPEINDSYYMEKLFLKLDTLGNIYRFYAGDLYVEYTEGYDKLIPWTGLEGIKKETPQISQILVDVESAFLIEEIWIGPHQVSRYFGEQLLVIHAPDDVFIFQSTYVKIVTEMGTTYLPQFNYFNNYQLLLSGFYHKYLI